jgi:pimeloyl-ACP methyl ester carboxylesterase
VLYAAAELVSPTDQDVVILPATSSPIKIWVNDAVQIKSAPGSVGADWYANVDAKVHLRAGRNSLLLKVICFPLRNRFAVFVATLDGAHEFIEEHGGVFDVLNQILVSRGVPLRLAPVIAIYDESPGQDEHYKIRDVVGRIAAMGHLATSGDAEINVSGLPDGLYSISLEKGTLTTGELFFVGDLTRRLAMYGAKCAAKAAGDLPCEALPKLIQTSKAEGVRFRLDKQKLMLLLMEQFEWSLHGVPPQMVFPDHAPRIRLISFRSNIDGSIQHYYLYLPPDVQSGQPLPLVVIMPFNTKRAPFFDNAPTTNPDGLQRYARFAGRYHLGFIIPFARGKQLLDHLAEDDVREAIQDAKGRFRVDDSRIYLAGECAGGRSAFLMAEDYPDVFSAVSTSGAATGPLSGATNSSADSGNPLLRLRNLSSIPIGLTQAEADPHSPESVALLLMQEAWKVGVFPKLTLTRGTGSFGLIDATRNMFEFFATVKRRDPAIPHHVALAVTELKHNHAFWIQVDRLRTTVTPGYITGDINAQNRINITSTNIRGVTIDTLKLPPGLAGRRPWVVLCNGGQEQRLLPDKSGQIVLIISEDGGRWCTIMHDIFAHLSWRLRSWYRNDHQNQ